MKTIENIDVNNIEQITKEIINYFDKIDYLYHLVIDITEKENIIQSFIKNRTSLDNN